MKIFKIPKNNIAKDVILEFDWGRPLLDARLAVDRQDDSFNATLIRIKNLPFKNLRKTGYHVPGIYITKERFEIAGVEKFKQLRFDELK